MSWAGRWRGRRRRRGRRARHARRRGARRRVAAPATQLPDLRVIAPRFQKGLESFFQSLFRVWSRWIKCCEGSDGDRARVFEVSRSSLYVSGQSVRAVSQDFKSEYSFTLLPSSDSARCSDEGEAARVCPARDVALDLARVVSKIEEEGREKVCKDIKRLETAVWRFSTSEDRASLFKKSVFFSLGCKIRGILGVLCRTSAPWSEKRSCKRTATPSTRASLSVAKRARFSWRKSEKSKAFEGEEQDHHL